MGRGAAASSCVGDARVLLDVCYGVASLAEASVGSTPTRASATDTRSPLRFRPSTPSRRRISPVIFSTPMSQLDRAAQLRREGRPAEQSRGPGSTPGRVPPAPGEREPSSGASEPAPPSSERARRKPGRAPQVEGTGPPRALPRPSSPSAVGPPRSSRPPCLGGARAQSWPPPVSPAPPTRS